MTAQPDPAVAQDERPLSERIEEAIVSGKAFPPVMPALAARVQEVTAREDFALRDLTEVIEQEAGLAARIIRYANSAAFGGLREVTDLHQAVSRLGASMVASVAVAAVTKELYTTDDQAERTTMERLWKHSMVTGEAGRIVARHVPVPEGEQAFLTCLVHDIGHVVILRALAIIEADQKMPISPGLRDEVRESLHPACGARLLESWKVPATICDAVRFHEEPERAAEGDLLPHLIAVADGLALRLGHGLGDRPEESLLSLPSAGLLRLDDLTLASIQVELEEALEAGHGLE